MVGKTAGLGTGLTVLLAGLLTVGWGSRFGLAAAAFGGLAVVLQTIAVRVMQPAIGRHHTTMFKRYGVGMALRIVGVAMIPVAVVVAREWFPPLAAAVGYLGVMVPLLFFETRLFR